MIPLLLQRTVDSSPFCCSAFHRPRQTGQGDTCQRNTSACWKSSCQGNCTDTCLSPSPPHWSNHYSRLCSCPATDHNRLQSSWACISLPCICHNCQHSPRPYLKLQSHPSLHTVAKQTKIRTQFSQLVTCMQPPVQFVAIGRQEQHIWSRVQDIDIIVCFHLEHKWSLPPLTMNHHPTAYAEPTCADGFVKPAIATAAFVNAPSIRATAKHRQQRLHSTAGMYHKLKTIKLWLVALRQQPQPLHLGFDCQLNINLIICSSSTAVATY